MGQHFLTNPAVGRRIAGHLRHLETQPGLPVVEIGPGKGILTREILGAGYRVVGVEKDPQLYHSLQETLPGDIHLIKGDILTFNPARLPISGPFLLVSNLPYYISRQTIDWMVENSQRISGGILMVQKEFCEKLLMKARLDARAHIFNCLYAGTILFSLRPGSFSPPPRVKSTVFSFSRRGATAGGIVIPDYYLFLKRAFSQRRKKLINSLTDHYPRPQLARALQKAGLNMNCRAETVLPEQFQDLYRVLHPS